MNWKEYEEVTKNIYHFFGKTTGVSIKCFGNGCKVIGKSNVKHQIDVLTEHSDGLHTYLTAIECKYWNSNINKDIIMKVAEIVEDARLNKGVIVSKLGFTKDAITYAEYKNIGLIELREVTNEDWENRIKTIKFETNIISPQITSFQLVLSKKIEYESPLKEGKTTVDSMAIRKANGEIISISNYIQEFNTELSKKNKNEKLSKVYKFDKTDIFIYTPTNFEIPEIRGIKIEGILNIGIDKFEINGEDHIWLILKTIFEDKTFTISKDGIINEQKK